MRTLVISDTHFGAWTGDPLLSHEFARDALAPQLEDVDELVLLGDLFDFLFSSVEHAFEKADPFFGLVQERMKGKRVVFLSGNHDHHIMVRDLRSAVELRVASGLMGMDFSDLYRSTHTSFFQRFLDRRLEGVETKIVYPHYRVGDALLFHGHYLDAHMAGSLADRLLTRGIWGVAGGRPADRLTIEDYESVIVPLTELLFTVAQLPRGTASQQAFYAQLQKVGRYLHLVGGARRAARGALSRLARDVASLRRRNADDERAIAAACRRGEPSVRMEPNGNGRGRSVRMEVVEACRPEQPVSLALEAYAQVVRNLGWDRDAGTFVFAHTHQPLGGVEHDGLHFWNTGSWIYEPPHGGEEAIRCYRERAWPGTAVLIDTAEPRPRLLELLADRNPLELLADRTPLAAV